MAARVIEINNEDNILETQVQYYTPLPKIPYTPASKQALVDLGNAMKAAHVHVNVQPLAKCDICGGDANWNAHGWERDYAVTLCDDHMKSLTDKYQSFDRL